MTTLKSGILPCSLTELAEMYVFELKDFEPHLLTASAGQRTSISQNELFLSALGSLKREGEQIGAMYIGNFEYRLASLGEGIQQYVATAIGLVPK